MSAPGRNPRELLIAAGVAALCALSAVIGLNALSKPQDFEARLAAVTRDAEAASRLSRATPRGRSFPADSVCSSGVLASEKVSRSLADLTAAQHLDRVTITVDPQAPATAAAGGLSPLSIRLHAAGPYEAVMAALDHLSDLRPLIFIDTVDLVSKTSFVTLSLSGRVFCAA